MCRQRQQPLTTRVMITFLDHFETSMILVLHSFTSRMGLKLKPTVIMIIPSHVPNNFTQLAILTIVTIVIVLLVVEYHKYKNVTPFSEIKHGN